MSNILKGNFETKKAVTVQAEGETLTETFEREALKRLGGSICFVAKKEIDWGDDDSGGTNAG
ncbi:MAG: hypothetical protein AAGH15_28245 [Myxococcota bacterium]